MGPKTSLLTITLNCMVAGLCAGILFSVFLCAIVLLIAASGGPADSTVPPYDATTVPVRHTSVVPDNNNTRTQSM